MQNDPREMLAFVRCVLVRIENGETAVGGGPSPSIGEAIDTLDRVLALDTETLVHILVRSKG